MLDELIERGDVLPMRPKKDGPYKTVFWNEVDVERGGRAVDKGETDRSQYRFPEGGVVLTAR